MNKKLDILEELKKTRGNSEEYILNSLRNLSRAAKLIHKNLKQNSHDKSLLDEAMRNYLISLASVLETFYRDICTYMLEKNEDLIKRILDDKNEKLSLSHFFDISKKKISFSELISSNLPFNNIEAIDSNISKLLTHQKLKYLDLLDSYEFLFIVPSKHSDLVKVKMPKKWRENLKNLFVNRHRLIHNANQEFFLTRDEMAEFETLVLLITQLTSSLIVEKYSHPILVCNEKPVLLVIEDLISEDWMVVEENE